MSKWNFTKHIACNHNKNQQYWKFQVETQQNTLYEVKIRNQQWTKLHTFMEIYNQQEKEKEKLKEFALPK